MGNIIYLDGTPITVSHLEIQKNSSGMPVKAITEFLVTSEDYHDITVLLYKGGFRVEIPSEDIGFHAVITKYAAPFTNLYEEGAEGVFQLELTESGNGGN